MKIENGKGGIEGEKKNEGRIRLGGRGWLVELQCLMEKMTEMVVRGLVFCEFFVC